MATGWKSSVFRKVQERRRGEREAKWVWPETTAHPLPWIFRDFCGCEHFSNYLQDGIHHPAPPISLTTAWDTGLRRAASD